MPRMCSRRLASLTRTDDAVRQLAPEPNSAARDRFAELLQHTPQSAAPAPSTMPATPVSAPKRGLALPSWSVGVAAGLAAALLVAVGWLGGRMTAPKAVVQAPTTEQTPPGFRAAFGAAGAARCEGPAHSGTPGRAGGATPVAPCQSRGTCGAARGTRCC